MAGHCRVSRQDPDDGGWSQRLWFSSSLVARDKRRGCNGEGLALAIRVCFTSSDWCLGQLECGQSQDLGRVSLGEELGVRAVLGTDQKSAESAGLTRREAAWTTESGDSQRGRNDQGGNSRSNHIRASYLPPLAANDFDPIRRASVGQTRSLGAGQWDVTKPFSLAAHPPTCKLQCLFVCLAGRSMSHAALFCFFFPQILPCALLPFLLLFSLFHPNLPITHIFVTSSLLSSHL